MENSIKLKQVDFKNPKDIQQALSFLRVNAKVSPLFSQYQGIIDKMPKLLLNCGARFCGEATSQYKSGMQFIEYNGTTAGIIGFFITKQKDNKIQQAELSVFLAPEFIANVNGVSVWKKACQSYIELLGKNEHEFNPKGEFVSKYVATNKVSAHIQTSVGITKASSKKIEEPCGDVSIVKLTGSFEDFFKNVVYPVTQTPVPRL